MRQSRGNGDTDEVKAEAREELRGVLLGIGLRENELLEPLVAELRFRGCRPRKSWRLANEFTQQQVAAEFNRLTGKPNAPMKAARISEYESWPVPRGTGRMHPRPTLEVLKNLAAIYRTSWDRLVDTADLAQMPSAEVAAYRAVVSRRTTALARWVAPETIRNDVSGRSARWRHEMRDRRSLIVFDNALDSKQVRALLPEARESVPLPDRIQEDLRRLGFGC
ncbi:hypothetical protein GPX89_40720 [Nocardia sp. ET3-3]|uniref:Uncharacterized protein n=1 Tax=Nocardia terrae TaxID=2675851 RepID=A0A7K1VAR1_9NOCA|nr:hypothetical protein [Nocardia terrae]MVU83549.1 hypothetical protein [Nocardia terrae]